jgi:hypothetical protein
MLVRRYCNGHLKRQTTALCGNIGDGYIDSQLYRMLNSIPPSKRTPALFRYTPSFPRRNTLRLCLTPTSLHISPDPVTSRNRPSSDQGHPAQSQPPVLSHRPCFLPPAKDKDDPTTSLNSSLVYTTITSLFPFFCLSFPSNFYHCQTSSAHLLQQQNSRAKIDQLTLVRYAHRSRFDEDEERAELIDNSS